MYAAAADHSLPRGYGRALLQVHDQKPFPYSGQEIAESAAQVKDKNYRIEAAEDGIHIYNSAGHFVAQDEPLDWGCATDRRAEDRTRLSEAGHTLRSRAANE